MEEDQLEAGVACDPQDDHNVDVLDGVLELAVIVDKSDLLGLPADQHQRQGDDATPQDFEDDRHPVRFHQLPVTMGGQEVVQVGIGSSVEIHWN